MEDLLIQRNKKVQYIFYPDLIVIKKKGKICREIKLTDIHKFFYNPKFRAKEMWTRILIVSFIRPCRTIWNTSVVSNTLNIFLNSGKKVIRMKIKPDEYEKVKQVMRLKEIGISGDF